MRKIATIIFIMLSLGIANAWFLVPMVYWDGEDGWTPYFAMGFGDSTKYGAAELRYSPDSNSIRTELTLDLPITGEGTQFYAAYIKDRTFDPRKTEIYLTMGDSGTTITEAREDVEEFRVRLHQKYKAGIESFWGIFADYRMGIYLSDYRRGEFSGFVDTCETTTAQFVSGGLSFGYDTRAGDMDPEAGYYFSIEAGACYLLQDTTDADYINATTNAPKIAGMILIDQFIYTPTSALPIEIPIFTVQAPTIIAVRTSGGYFTSEMPQLMAWKGSDFNFFRGFPQRKLSGYGFFVLVGDIRISPVARMYTPLTLLHLIAPRTIPDARADIEIIPSIDIGKIYGAEPEEQFYTWGLGFGLKFGKRLTTRLEILWTPSFDDYVTTNFSIKHPF